MARVAAAIRASIVIAATLGAVVVPASSVAAPRVASINVCTDQLVLSMADPEQIATLSWLASDPEESLYAELARAFPPNYGSAEEVLRFDPDVVIAGAYTGAFTRALLTRLGYRVVDVAPAEDLEGITANLRLVAEAIGQTERAEQLVARLHAQADAYRARATPPPADALVIRPGGFTVERGSLADSMMTMAGLRNIAAELGLDRWGSLSVETLLRTEPEVVVLPTYRSGDVSLAHAALQHPAITKVLGDVPTARLPSAAWGCGTPETLGSVAALQQAVVELREARELREMRLTRQP